jgi:hypothetical protein
VGAGASVSGVWAVATENRGADGLVLRRLLEEWPQFRAPRMKKVLRAEHGLRRLGGRRALTTPRRLLLPLLRAADAAARADHAPEPPRSRAARHARRAGDPRRPSSPTTGEQEQGLPATAPPARQAEGHPRLAAARGDR